MHAYAISCIYSLMHMRSHAYIIPINGMMDRMIDKIINRTIDRIIDRIINGMINGIANGMINKIMDGWDGLLLNFRIAPKVGPHLGVGLVL